AALPGDPRSPRPVAGQGHLGRHRARRDAVPVLAPPPPRRASQGHALSVAAPSGPPRPATRASPRTRGRRAIRDPETGFPRGGGPHSPAALPATGLSPAALVLLGVIALGSLAQAVFLLVLGRELLAMGRRLDAFQSRLSRDLHPLIEDVTRATRNLSAA